MCEYGVGCGKAAAQRIITQPAKSEQRQLPLLLLTLLLLKPLLLLTSQMATLGLTHRLRSLGPGACIARGLHSQAQEYGLEC